MFRPHAPKSRAGGALNVLELIYHNTVRSVRSTHSNAVLAILLSMLQVVMMVVIFWAMFTLLGMKSLALRGDFVLYIMSGVMLYMIHIQAVRGVSGAQPAASGMMKHAPMNTAIALLSSAASVLYIQTLGMAVVLYVYHTVWGPIFIHDLAGAYGMVLVAWASGCAVGLLFYALKPWLPRFTGIAVTIYTRASMITSGKMFVANSLPGYMLAWFDWNPLFHAIDQARGYVFANYFPHHSDWHYAVAVTFALTMIGLMGEAYTRRNASMSWSAGK